MYFCLISMFCWTNGILDLMIKNNIKSEVFIQGDDLWGLHYGCDLDHVHIGTKVNFSCLCLAGAGCQIRIGIYDGVWCKISQKPGISFKADWMHLEEQYIWSWHQSRCPGLSQLKAVFKGEQHLSTVSAALCTCPGSYFLFFCFFFFFCFLFFCKNQPTNL